MIYLLMTISLMGQSNLSENDLVNELGCGNCHSGVQNSNLIKNNAPDLSYSGLKYNEAYIYDYLKSPETVRQHIGNSRMPNFNFSDDEAYALTLYLMSKVSLPKDRTLTKRKYKSKDNTFELINTEYQCTVCHSLNGSGINKSIDMSISGRRLNPDWLFDIILKPSAYVPRGSPMPTFFNEDEESYEKISDIVGYLNDLDRPNLDKLNLNYKKVSKKNTLVTAEMGQSIFLSQNCMACHTMDGEEAWFVNHNAPDLSAQKMKTKKEWLLNYLKEPSAIRPNGYFPGTGSRMPNFNLSQNEIENIMKWLGSATLKTKLEPISAFQSRKVERLLNDFLPCLGCHELNGKGGQIGPSLSNSGNRLFDGYIKMSIQAPHMVMPESIMPKTAMDPKLIPLLQSYFSNSISEEKSEYLNLIEHKPYPISNQYSSTCAPCHGLEGKGNGFNAAYLPVPPGNLADGNVIGQRADDTLFETIYGGGRIMNKSHFMPGWGEKLSREEIVNHVSQIRNFCDCSAPEWSKN